MELNQVLVAEFVDEMAVTGNFLNAIPEALYEFTPHEKSKNIIDFLNHIVPISSWVAVIATTSVLDWSTAQAPEKLLTKQDVLKQFKENVAIGKKALESIDNKELLENWTMQHGETIFFSGKKQVAIRRYVLNHTIHHRAQLGMYLRLNNLPVPASYVASADAQLF